MLRLRLRLRLWLRLRIRLWLRHSLSFLHNLLFFFRKPSDLNRRRWSETAYFPVNEISSGA